MPQSPDNRSGGFPGPRVQKAIQRHLVRVTLYGAAVAGRKLSEEEFVSLAREAYRMLGKPEVYPPITEEEKRERGDGDDS